MAESNPNAQPRRTLLIAVVAFGVVAVLVVGITALLTNIFERKQDARVPFVRVVDVTEDTIDPKEWAKNWPLEYDGYLRTSEPTTTKYGGRGPGGSDAMAAEKLDRDPWLKRLFAGYAFSIDYRDRRGH